VWSRGAARLLPLILAALAVAFWLDSRSMERANRLFRSGQLADASELYQRLASGASPKPEVSYNFGTSLLALEMEDAERHLVLASGATDPLVAQRANRNLGYLHLTRVAAGMETDTAVALVARSILRTRLSLRLEPTDADARWNLALGERMLDSLTHLRLPPENQANVGSDRTLIDLEALARASEADGVSGLEPERPPPATNIGQRRGASVGAHEAWAYQDPGPLSEADAADLLRQVKHDPEKLMRGLLWAHRPDVAWWNAEVSPGGGW
jgi:hypothetical protein